MFSELSERYLSSGSKKMRIKSAITTPVIMQVVHLLFMPVKKKHL